MERARQNEKNNKNYHNGHCACSHSPSVIPTVGIDSGSRKLVGIGHSMGAAALYVDCNLLQLDCLCSLLSLGYSPTLIFECLILCELTSMAQRFIQGKPDIW